MKKIYYLLFAICIVGCRENCSPTVNKWKVTPETICPDESVTVSWDVVNATEIVLSAEPQTSPPLTSTTSLNGSTSVKPLSDDTTIRLIAKNGDKVSVPTPYYVHIVRELELRPMSFSWSGCTSGSGDFMDIVIAGQSDQLVIQSVTNDMKDRNVTIGHGGVSVRLAPNASTSAFNGTTFNGRWIGKGELLSNNDPYNPIQEGCGQNSTGVVIIYKDPPPVAITVTLGCK